MFRPPYQVAYFHNKRTPYFCNSTLTWTEKNKDYTTPVYNTPTSAHMTNATFSGMVSDIG